MTIKCNQDLEMYPKLYTLIGASCQIYIFQVTLINGEHQKSHNNENPCKQRDFEHP